MSPSPSSESNGSVAGERPNSLSQSTPRALAAAARRLYPGGPWVRRRRIWYRPYICPFGALLAHVPSGSRVLDVGCGSGLFLALLNGAGQLREGVGFDSSSAAIAAAKRMSAREVDDPGRLHFQTLSVSAPWPVGQFDVVSMIDVMHHLPPRLWLEVLSRVHEHVRPGGRLLYKDMCRRPRWRAELNRVHDLAISGEWVHYAPIELVESRLCASGFELIQSKDISVLWYGHELRVFLKAG
jgi:SAM-dependent methyltransferase